MKKILIMFTLIFTTILSSASAHNYCFIGDSRFVGMKQSVEYNNNVKWIAKVSMGNAWVWQHMNTIQSLDKDTIIIYEMGVNDLDSAECISVLNHLKELGFTHIYFSTITPVNEEKCYSYGYSRTNSQIQTYNRNVLNNLPNGVKLISSYDTFINNGFNTLDGIHYTNDTYQMWYQYIMKQVEKDFEQVQSTPVVSKETIQKDIQPQEDVQSAENPKDEPLEQKSLTIFDRIIIFLKQIFRRD